MEIANVAGIDGLLAMIKDSEKLPFRLLLEIPSRVPTAPGLETTGGVLGVEEVTQLLGLDEAVSLGETGSFQSPRYEGRIFREGTGQPEQTQDL